MNLQGKIIFDLSLNRSGVTQLIEHLGSDRYLYEFN